MKKERPWSVAEIELLKNHPKEITHMRSRFFCNRFGLILGSGICKPLEFPNWEELVVRISKDPEVNGEKILEGCENKENQTSRIQILYQHFKAKHYSPREKKILSSENELKIKKHWRDIIHKHLYSSSTDNGNIKEEHPYLGAYTDVIKNTQLTINYNFDDVIERLLLQSRNKSEKELGIGYETVWHYRMQFKSDKAVIYHPNGFLPRNILENPSENLVFSEYEFADQLISSLSGHYSTILHHLTKNTCLLIGLSLEDSTLKHLLRQNANMNPGHFHYHIVYVSDEEAKKLDPERYRAIYDANFEVYNLITLFLTNEQIKALGNLITMNKDQLYLKAKKLGVSLFYVYYLTGVIGIGKTTVLSHFRSLSTIDEWFEQRHPILAIPSNKLKEKQKAIADKWIAREFFLKNTTILKENEGVFIIDRCPIDPIAFTPKDEIRRKAKLLIDSIGPEQTGYKAVSGHVILLTGDEKQISSRISYKSRKAESDYIKNQQDILKNIYSGRGCTIINTSGSDINRVVKLVAKVIYKNKYTKKSIHNKLHKIERGEINVTV